VKTTGVRPQVRGEAEPVRPGIHMPLVQLHVRQGCGFSLGYSEGGALPVEHRRDAQGLKRINDGGILEKYSTHKLIDELGSHALRG
jgi:hypothetical protein